MFVHLLLKRFLFFIVVSSDDLVSSKPASILRLFLSVAQRSRDKQKGGERETNKFVLPCCFDIKYYRPSFHDEATNAWRVKNIFLSLCFLCAPCHGMVSERWKKAEILQDKKPFVINYRRREKIVQHTFLHESAVFRLAA
jgi:hypothetical protein